MHVGGAWVGGTVRSPVARGTLRGFEFDAGFDRSSVVIVGPEDVPGDNVLALIEDDQPILGSRDMRHFGEPLLLVAAPDLRDARSGAGSDSSAVSIRSSPLLDMERSRASVRVGSDREG